MTGRVSLDDVVALLRRIGSQAPDALLREVAVDVLRRWDEPHRHYHNRAHLEAVLGHLDELQATDLPRLAAWFHDAVYDPRRTGNEEASAVLAAATLRELGVEQSVVDEVGRLVTVTRTHDPADGDRDGQVLCDADLAILATPPETYDAYAAAIRQEYAHVGDDDFRRGRAAVLLELTGRPLLFRTVHGRASWEPQARDNIVRELGSLLG